MAYLFAPSREQALIVVWYEFEAEPVLSPENRKRIELLDWNARARGVE